MTEYECLITIHVFADDGESTGQTLMVLPFAPFDGLAIAGIPPNTEPVSVEDVIWDPVAQRFLVQLESDDATEVASSEPILLAAVKVMYGADWTWKDRAP